MKKSIVMMLLGVLVMPCVMSGFLFADPVIVKRPNGDATKSKNEIAPPVTIDYNDSTKIITLDFAEDVKSVEVSVYKDGELIYQDNDIVESDATLNYEICDAEQGEYTVSVVADDEPAIEETVTVE